MFIRLVHSPYKLSNPHWVQSHRNHHTLVWVMLLGAFFPVRVRSCPSPTLGQIIIWTFLLNTLLPRNMLTEAPNTLYSRREQKLESEHGKTYIMYYKFARSLHCITYETKTPIKMELSHCCGPPCAGPSVGHAMRCTHHHEYLSESTLGQTYKLDASASLIFTTKICQLDSKAHYNHDGSRGSEPT